MEGKLVNSSWLNLFIYSNYSHLKQIYSLVGLTCMINIGTWDWILITCHTRFILFSILSFLFLENLFLLWFYGNYFLLLQELLALEEKMGTVSTHYLKRNYQNALEKVCTSLMKKWGIVWVQRTTNAVFVRWLLLFINFDVKNLK